MARQREVTPENTEFVILCFEGPDPYSLAGGLGVRVDYLSSTLAQMGFPNMELPILYALTHPERLADDGTVRFDPVAAGALTFEPLRRDVFPAFALGVAAGRSGGTAPAAFNAANEVAVAAFLGGHIPFGRIAEVIELVLEAQTVTRADTLEAVHAADAWARRRAAALSRGEEA